ncbi:ABC transporter permease [Corynebacterium falsenii]|uniref:ABC transporter permease n=1 Tax=Corynebacterium falsenii TaxID=108486 RepID=A0A418Q9T8_9CORY|nr:ABC transporter permease [Corynebacterium falsenii]MDC7103005.1 ABC transporter permease [Corynebacterium falsenii]RIX36758.1 ABC transporter permease [Corynebacterium falsenii]
MNALRSEITKLTSVRSTWIYLILLTGALYGPVVLLGVFGEASNGPARGWGSLLQGAQIFQMIAIIMAGSWVGSDIKHNMNAHAFLTQPRRSNWLVAKMVVAGLFTFSAFVVGCALAWVAATVVGIDVDAGEGLGFLTTAAIGYPLWAVATVGLAALVRSQVAAISLPLVWILVLEPLINKGAESVSAIRPLATILPNSTMVNISYDNAVFDHASLGVAGIVVLLAWLGALIGIGLWANASRDVR